MTALTPLNKTCIRFRNSLLTSIRHFRQGEDNPGLDCFLNCIDDLKSLIELQVYHGEPNIDLKQIVQIFQRMYICMQNQDIIGLTDVLEYSLYPEFEKVNHRYI